MAALLEAVVPTGMPTVIVPSTKCVAKADFPMIEVSSNVTVRQWLSSVYLRQLYDRLRSGSAAGTGPAGSGSVNGVPEAMAMRKPLVVSATPGIAEYVDDGESALVVPRHNLLALGAAIFRLLTDEGAASGLANAGHAVVASGLNLDGYAKSATVIASERLT